MFFGSCFVYMLISHLELEGIESDAQDMLHVLRKLRYAQNESCMDRLNLLDFP